MADADTSAAALAAVACLHPVFNVVSCSCTCAACLLYLKVDMQAGTQYIVDSEKRAEKTTPFGVNLMRSQVLYRAAHRQQ